MKICDIDNGFEVRTNRNKFSRGYQIHDEICLVMIKGDKPSKFLFLDGPEKALEVICELRLIEEFENVSSW